jgi:hypothetical protein
MNVYAAGVLYCLSAWALLFILAPRIRREMLIAGIAWGHSGPILEYWHHRDYWTPEYAFPLRVGDWTFGAEDYAFAFCYAGLAAGLFHLFLDEDGALPDFRPTLQKFLRLQVFGAAFLASFVLLAALSGMNSVHALAVLSLAASLVILARHPGWLTAAGWAAAITASWYAASYWAFVSPLFPDLLERWWHLDNLSGIRLRGLPIEEVVWASSTALVIGPVYRVTMSD